MNNLLSKLTSNYITNVSNKLAENALKLLNTDSDIIESRDTHFLQDTEYYENKRKKNLLDILSNRVDDKYVIFLVKEEIEPSNMIINISNLLRDTDILQPNINIDSIHRVKRGNYEINNILIEHVYYIQYQSEKIIEELNNIEKSPILFIVPQEYIEDDISLFKKDQTINIEIVQIRIKYRMKQIQVVGKISK